jgi:hypothetical protein
MKNTNTKFIDGIKELMAARYKKEVSLRIKRGIAIKRLRMANANNNTRQYGQ